MHHNTVNLFCGDCVQEMAKIPDKSVDMIFTDPPYGTTQNEWDRAMDIEGFFQEAKRIITDNGVIAVWAQPPFSFRLGVAGADIFRYEWIVEKSHATGFLNARRMPLKAHESILVFYKKLPVYNPQKTHGHKRKVSTASHKRNSKKSTNYGEHGLTTYDSTDRFPRDVLKFAWDKQKSRLHPTQKPVSACEYFIETYTDPSMIVLDPYMGSGSTGVAAVNKGRKFIGIELDNDFFVVAKERILQTQY